MPRIPALGGQNQEVGELEASLGYTVRPRKKERGVEGEGRKQGESDVNSLVLVTT